MPRTRKITDDKKLSLDVFNLNGKISGKIDMPEEIFSAKANPHLIAQMVRIHLANKRSGTHSSKTRTEVTGSTRKIYRQKGTGRARHGDIKAPIFIGGGVAHGPRPRDYTLDFPKKMKRKALFSALSLKFAQGNIRVVTGLKDMPSKTKEMVNFLKALFPTVKTIKNILLVLGDKKENVHLSGRNIPFLDLESLNTLHAYPVLCSREILLEKEAVLRMPEVYKTDIVKGKKTEKVSRTTKKSIKAEESKVLSVSVKPEKAKTSSKRPGKVKKSAGAGKRK